MQPGDKDDGQLPDAAAILDAVIDLVAEEEAENGEPTEEDIRWSRDVRRQIQARIGALRHLQAARSAVNPGRPPGDQELTSVEPVKPAAPMGDDTHALRALDREALLARLKNLRPPGAHPDLASLSDEDLRRMLARLTGPTEGGRP